MPIYEYICGSCNRIFQFLVRESSARDSAPPCPRCGEVTRRVLSGFSIGGAASGGGADLSTEEMSALSGEDPRAMASAIRRMAGELGEPLEPEMLEALSRLEAGEDPGEIERDLETSRPGSGSPARDAGLYEYPHGHQPPGFSDGGVGQS